MSRKIICPKCGSENLSPLQKGRFYCEDCEAVFTPEENGGITVSSKKIRPMKVFISYAHAQNEIVAEIAKAIRARGHIVLIDYSDIEYGKDWRKELTKSLADCDNVLSFLSREAIRDGGVCLDELKIAVGVKYGNIYTVLLHKEKDLQPIPAQLTRRQWLDMSDWEERRIGNKSDYREWLNQKISEIIRKIESVETREFAGQIDFIRSALNIDDTSISKQGWFLRKPFMERELLRTSIESWLDDPNGGHMCAVYGGPGTGKSHFAAHYVYFNFRVAASLFFEYDNKSFNSADVILRELIFQLSCRLPEYRSLLVYELENIINPEAMNTQEKFERFLAVPLQRALEGDHEPLCVVVDGLDECAEKDRRIAAGLLSAKHFPKWLRVLVLTRPENSVIGNLCPDMVINMNDCPGKNEADIRKYYEARLNEQLKERSDRDALLNKLSELANGVFLYACIVSDMILDGKLRIDDVDAYPENLNSSFYEWFSRYFPDVEEFNRLYKLPLGIIAACETPVPVEELETADGEFDKRTGCFHLRKQNPDERPQSMVKRLERCAQLLRYDTNAFGKTTVRFSHQYIAEWLSSIDPATGQSASEYYFCLKRDAMWAMERSWRRRLDAGRPLTEYQALNLLAAMIRAGETDEEIKRTASNEIWGKTLIDNRKEYKKTIKYDLSLLFAQADYDRRCRAFGEEDPDTLTALANLAVILGKLDRQQEALEKKEQVYKACLRIYGEDHPETRNAQSSLAITLGKLGRHQEALEIQEQVYAARARIYGEDHPCTRNELNNLAVTLGRLGRHQEALEKQEQIYAARVRKYGEAHKSTRNALNNLAVTLGRLGRYREALEKQEQLYKDRLRIYGEDHPGTRIAKNNLAYTLGELGRHQEALEKQEQLYEDRLRIYGEDHRSTCIALNNLAVTLGKLGRYREALEKLQHCYEIRKRNLGEDNWRTLQTLLHIGETLHSLGRNNEALETLERCYDDQKRIFGESSQNALDTLKVLEDIRGNTGRE